MESISLRPLAGALFFLLIGGGTARGAVAGKDLEGIKRRIESEKKGLSQLQAQEGSVLKSLGKITDDLDKKAKELKAADARYNSILGAIEKTENQLSKLRGSISQREDLFRQRAAALYRWQRRGDPFGLIAGAGDLSARRQHQRYMQATLTFDRGLLGELQNQSQRQESLRLHLGAQKEQLAAQKQVLALARAAVAQEMEKKQILLSSLRQEKDTRLKALREMEAAAQRLQKMLDDIARRATVKPRQTPPPPASSGRGLEALMGQMEWPAKGPVSAPFGKFQHPEFATELVRKGIDIDAALGEDVRAVEKGRVVFADRFSGYGRMVIVDHGERYYTIYGHLSEIVKKNGDELRRGETLGRVGDSDSLGGAKLYFELRKDGRSVDPLAWLKKR